MGGTAPYIYPDRLHQRVRMLQYLGYADGARLEKDIMERGSSEGASLGFASIRGATSYLCDARHTLGDHVRPWTDGCSDPNLNGEPNVLARGNPDAGAEDAMLGDCEISVCRMRKVEPRMFAKLYASILFILLYIQWSSDGPGDSEPNGVRNTTMSGRAAHGGDGSVTRVASGRPRDNIGRQREHRAADDATWRCVAWEARRVGGSRGPGPRDVGAITRDRKLRRQLFVRRDQLNGRIPMVGGGNDHRRDIRPELEERTAACKPQLGREAHRNQRRPKLALATILGITLAVIGDGPRIPEAWHAGIAAPIERRPSRAVRQRPIAPDLRTGAYDAEGPEVRFRLDGGGQRHGDDQLGVARAQATLETIGEAYQMVRWAFYDEVSGMNGLHEGHRGSCVARGGSLRSDGDEACGIEAYDMGHGGGGDAEEVGLGPTRWRCGDWHGRGRLWWSSPCRVVPAASMQLYCPSEPFPATGLLGTDAVCVFGDIAHRLSNGDGQRMGRPPGTAVMQMHRTPDSPSRARLGCAELVAFCPRGRPSRRGSDAIPGLFRHRGARACGGAAWSSDQGCGGASFHLRDDGLHGIGGQRTTDGDSQRAHADGLPTDSDQTPLYPSNGDGHDDHLDDDLDRMAGHPSVVRGDVVHLGLLSDDWTTENDEHAHARRLHGRNEAEDDPREQPLQGDSACATKLQRLHDELASPLPSRRPTSTPRRCGRLPAGTLAADTVLTYYRWTSQQRNAANGDAEHDIGTPQVAAGHITAAKGRHVEAEDQRAHDTDGARTVQLGEGRDYDSRDIGMVQTMSGGHDGEWWPEVYRVGEAANPGPRRADAPSGPPAPPDVARRRLLEEGEATVRYPKPGQQGLSNFLSSGHAQPATPSPGFEEFRLVVESVNTTGWTSLKRRLMTTSAHVVLAQETWVPQSSIAAASAWAKKRGWRSIWSPARVTNKGGVSGGVAILARDFMGLHYPAGGPHELRRSRAVAGTLEAPGNRPIDLVSCYLQHGCGAADANAAILADIGAAFRSDTDGARIIGGDFNMSPEELLGTGYDRELGATIVHTETSRGTFRTAKVRSTLDYFLVADRLTAAIDGVATVEGSGVRGHTPVQLTFKPRLATLKALHVRQPPRLGLDRVHGPLPQPPPCDAPAALARAALAAARADIATFDDLLEVAYASWANIAEEEIGDYTGLHAKLCGERAKRPRLVWRSVLPETKLLPTFSKPAAAVWLRGVASELQRIVKVAADVTGAAPGNDDATPSMPVVGNAADTEGDLANGAMDIDLDDDDMDMDAPHCDDCDHDASSTRERRRRGPSTTWRSACQTLEEIYTSLFDDFPAGEPDAATMDAWRKVRDLVERISIAARPQRDLAQHAGDDHWRPPVGAPWDAAAASSVADLTMQADALRGELDALDAATAAAQKTDEAKQWREWLTQDFKAGASRAHAYSRTPQEVIPEAVRFEGGAMTSTPEALMEAQRTKYRALWRPAQGPYRYDWSDKSELPRLTAAQLRAVALTFPKKTSQTFDGFHPRQFAFLSDAALDVLSDILQAVEVSGRWPRQLSLVITALLPKPKGGFRPIGILPGAYRVWAKARREWTDKWETDHARQYLSSARGNGALDTMWRISARQEAGTAFDDQAGVVADDLASFFETVDREVLMREARELNYPLPILRAALATYSAARMLTMQGRVAREVYPTVGVIAGCSLAMSLTKLLYLRTLDAVVARLPPRVVLDVHVDDLTLSAVGPPHQVITDLTAARVVLADAMGDLGCSLAADKTAVTATSRRLASALAKSIGVEADTRSTPCLLGVDNTAGAARRRLGGKSRKATRLKAALVRKGRLKAIRAVVGRKAGHVFRAGLLPAAAYDAPIWGVSDKEALALRRLAAVAMSPRARGRSLALVHLWHGLPTADAEHAPAVQYSKMVWRAVTRREEAAMRGSSLSDLSAMWHAARVNFEPLVEQIFEERLDDGTVPPAVARQIWAQVKGPIAAAAVTLARIGWRFNSPFQLIDNAGTEHTLTSASPTLIRDYLRDAMRDALERKVADRWTELDGQFAGRRACLDLAISASRPSRRVTHQQAACFRAVVCGAIWTAARARDLGYDTDGLCALCACAPDTIHHRVYVCSHTRDAVKAAVPPWFWEEAMRTGARSPFWVTGVFPHPGDEAPAPRADVYCEVEHHTTDGQAAATAANRTHISGSVYIDGSCTPSPIRGLARAAGSLVMMGEGGLPFKTLQLPVPRHLPQTSQAAEYFMMSAAFSFVRGSADFVGDCLNVVRRFTSAAAKALAPNGKYAGLILPSFRDPEARRTVGVRWTKAHRTLVGDEPPEVAADIRGNAAADEAAKAAVAFHPAFGVDVEAAVAYYTRRAPHVVAAVTAAMSLFPRAPVGMGRLPRPANAEEARAAERHHWRFAAGTWRCEFCDDYITARTIPTYRRHQRCSGKGMADLAASFAGNGHTLVKADADMPIVMCTQCGAWGNRRTRKLGRPCEAPTQAGQQALRCLLRGWHPLPQQSTRGVRATRTSARIVAAYNAIEGRWTAVVPVREGTTAQTGAAPEGMVVDETSLTSPVPEHCHGTLPPCDDGERSDEEDVFGHGGNLTGDADASHADSGVPLTVASISAAPAPVTRRRPRTDGDQLVRDYVAEAVERLGSTLMRRDTDASGRMERLRRRVAAKDQPADDGVHGLTQHGNLAIGGPEDGTLVAFPAEASPTVAGTITGNLVRPHKRQRDFHGPHRQDHGDHPRLELLRDTRARAGLHLHPVARGCPSPRGRKRPAGILPPAPAIAAPKPRAGEVPTAQEHDRLLDAHAAADRAVETSPPVGTRKSEPGPVPAYDGCHMPRERDQHRHVFPRRRERSASPEAPRHDRDCDRGRGTKRPPTEEPLSRGGSPPQPPQRRGGEAIDDGQAATEEWRSGGQQHQQGHPRRDPRPSARQDLPRLDDPHDDRLRDRAQGHNPLRHDGTQEHHGRVRPAARSHGRHVGRHRKLRGIDPPPATEGPQMLEDLRCLEREHGHDGSLHDRPSPHGRGGIRGEASSDLGGYDCDSSENFCTTRNDCCSAVDVSEPRGASGIGGAAAPNASPLSRGQRRGLSSRAEPRQSPSRTWRRTSHPVGADAQCPGGSAAASVADVAVDPTAMPPSHIDASAAAMEPTPPALAWPSTRAELIARLRHAGPAYSAAAGRSPAVSGGPQPNSSPIDARSSGHRGALSSIRRQCMRRSASHALVASGRDASSHGEPAARVMLAHPLYSAATASRPAASDADAARRAERAISSADGQATAAAATTSHPVLPPVPAGVGPYSDVLSRVTAAAGPVRRRIVGKQRVPDTGINAPQTVATQPPRATPAPAHRSHAVPG